MCEPDPEPVWRWWCTAAKRRGLQIWEILGWMKICDREYQDPQIVKCIEGIQVIVEDG